jgi:anti-sigma-K factor RskA
MNEELDIAAAEYVLGTLPADERALFVARLGSDPALQEAVRRWQAHLAPLDAAVPAENPPAGVWRAIERIVSNGRRPGELPAGTAAVAGGTNVAGEASNVAQLRRRVAAWRSAALITGALAAGLLGFVVVDRLSVESAAPAQGGRYIAVVDTGGEEPALIAEVDTATGLIRVRSVAAETPAGSSLELWHVAEGGAPRSLGVLAPGEAAQTIQDAVAAGPIEGVLAVSVEPVGGSPSGAPTGPVIYSGRLIPVE